MMKIIHVMFLILCMSLALRVEAQSELKRYRPKHCIIHHETGVLTSYGLGNRYTVLSIRLANGKEEEFFMHAPNLINGKHWNCILPPISSVPDECPSGLVVGVTRVRVTYWYAKIQAERSKVSDEIDIITEKQ